MKSKFFKNIVAQQFNLGSWRSQSEDLIERLDEEKYIDAAGHPSLEMVNIFFYKIRLIPIYLIFVLPRILLENHFVI